MRSLSENEVKQPLPFEAFTVPNLSRKPEKVAEPVSWFTVLAPRIPEEPKEGVAFVPTLMGDPTQPQCALFPNVDEIAAETLRQKNESLAEPPELVLLRAQIEMDAELIEFDAQQRATKILVQAQQDGYAVGYAEGLAKGQADGQAQALAQFEQERALYRADIEDFIAHIEAERVKTWHEMEPLMIRMVFELSAKVIKQEIEVNRDVTLSLVRNALRRVVDSTTLRIRVHGDDLETVRTNRADLLTLVDGANHVEIIEDRRVSLGGCIIETNAGSIDARIETQLDSVSDALEQMVEYRQAA